MFVQLYGTTLSCWPWTTRKHVFCIGMCLNFNSCSVFDVVWACNLTLMFCVNILQWQQRRLCVYVRSFNCIERYRVGPGQPESKFVLGCVWIWKRYSRSIQYEVVISPWMICCANSLQWRWRWRWRWRLCVHSWNVWNGVVLTLTVNEQQVCVCNAVCLNLKLFVVFATARGCNLTLMCCANALKYRRRLCDYVRCIYGTVSCVLALGEQHVRLYCCAWIWSCFPCAMYVVY